MEIPSHLKKLYHHWPDHISHSPPASPLPDNPLLENLVSFAAERMYIWSKKHSGLPPPYTSDPVLKNYRFCNVYRELDRQTIAIHTSLAQIPNFPTWLLNLAFQRFVCRPATIAQIGFLNFNVTHNRQIMDRLTHHVRPKYGTAYVFPISSIQKSPHPTREEFFCLYLPQVMPQIIKIISKFHKLSVSQALNLILPSFGFNLRFHWTEILIDIAYRYPQFIDLFGPFPIGPGAVPIFNLLGIPDLPRFVLPNFPYLTYKNRPVFLSAENWEGLCCEYRKYQNLKSGRGRIRKFSSS